MKMNREKVQAALASQVKHVSSRDALDLKHALGVSQSVRFQQGVVLALADDESTCTVQFPGASSPATGIPYFDVLPCPNKGCWVATDGEDGFVVSIGKGAPGSGSVRLSKAADTVLTSGAEEEIIFSNPMTDAGAPQNRGWDFYGWGYSATTALGNTDRCYGWGNSGPLTLGMSRWYLPAPGIWDLRGVAIFAGVSPAANTRRVCHINLGDSGTGTQLGGDCRWPNSAQMVYTEAHATYRTESVTATPYITFSVYQNQGAGLNVLGDRPDSSYLVARWLGPAGTAE